MSFHDHLGGNNVIAERLLARCRTIVNHDCGAQRAHGYALRLLALKITLRLSKQLGLCANFRFNDAAANVFTSLLRCHYGIRAAIGGNAKRATSIA
jgi:hypothetical protein